MSEDRRRPLLLFFVAADDPQRDAACATLAWLAAEEGRLFECYFESPHSGIHFGGGHPGWFQPKDLRGGTLTGGHHIEEFYRVLEKFQCEAVCLGTTMFESLLRDACVPIRATAPNVATLYRELFAKGTVAMPTTVLLIGDGGRPQGVPMGAYAFPEVVHRRLLGLADGDDAALANLAPRRRLQGIWLPSGRRQTLEAAGYVVESVVETSPDPSVAAQTAFMAKRWTDQRHGFLLGDPELTGRMIPTAVRNGWAPLYGVPQADVIALMDSAISEQSVVYGRQYNDQDFFQLSKRGVAFQLFDPGRPPFPVIREAQRSWPTFVGEPCEPSDAQLRQWAAEGRILTTLLFWTGMIRELENLYALADLFSITGLSAGLILSTESFAHLAHPPLTLAYVPKELGGLRDQIELLLVDVGDGVVIAGEGPVVRFARTLKQSVGSLAAMLGDPRLMPRGWWGTMDVPLRPRARPRISRYPEFPQLRLRHKPRPSQWSDPGAPSARSFRGSFRSMVRESPLGRFFEPLRPYDAYSPGPPSRQILQAVRDAGFEYAFTKSGFGPVPRVVTGIDGLTVLNHTAGRWDGWTPFVTINALADVKVAERRLARRHGPGWLVGMLDTCLWTFTGPIWGRATELDAISRLITSGGRSGRLVNVTPRTVARYARILAEDGQVEQVPAG